jgi:hypothetical protein
MNHRKFADAMPDVFERLSSLGRSLDWMSGPIASPGKLNPPARAEAEMSRRTGAFAIAPAHRRRKARFFDSDHSAFLRRHASELACAAGVLRQLLFLLLYHASEEHEDEFLS